MGVQVGAIEFFAGPRALGGPDDLEDVIRWFIDGARKELLIAVQELDSPTIAKAIVNAKRRKVQVHIILEGSYLRDDPPAKDPWSLLGKQEENRNIHNGLLRAGIDVIVDLNPEIFHQKFMVRDRQLGSAAVLTGSANFTLTDTGTNPITAGIKAGNNLNHVVVLKGKRIATEYAVEFQRYRAGTFGVSRERIEPKPAELRLSKVRITPLFAPRHGPEMEIMKQMLKAKTSVDFAMFTFAKSSGIDDTMFRLVRSLQRLRGVLDRAQGAQDWAATVPLKNAGVQLFQNRLGTGVRKVHHKLMVLDGRVTIVGSFNYTAPATTLNDENIIVLGDLEETDATAEAGQQALAGFALAEITAW